MTLSRALLARLRQVHRSSGWPCGDALEIELLAAGLASMACDSLGRQWLQLTPQGLAALAASLEANRARRDAHEALVERVALWMHGQGRLVWRSPAMRAAVESADTGRKWALGLPDVYSLRHSSREDRLEPIAHEVKVSRADLLSDLKRPEKRAPYLAVSCQLYYVLGCDARGRPIARADELPPECGVVQAGPDRLEVLRPAPSRAQPALGFAVWMALAKADRFRPDEDGPQMRL